MGKHGWFAVFGLIVSILTFNILLVLKIDSHVKYAWYFIFIPLWLAFLFYVWILMWIFEIIDERPNMLGGVSWMIYSGFCIIGWTILLSLKLEISSFQNVNWAYIFIPYWFACLQFLLIDPHLPEFKHKFHTKQQNKWKRYINVLPINSVAVLIVFGILIVLRLEGIISHDWTVVFIPMWYLCAISILICFTNASEMGFAEHRNTEILWLGVVVPSLFGIVFFLFAILMVLYLDGIIHKVVYSFIPLWIMEVVGLYVVCVAPCLLNFDDD